MSLPPQPRDARLRELVVGRGRSAALPPLHVVTDDAVVARDGFVDAADAVIAAGAADLCLHLRAPGMTGRRLMEMANALRYLVAGRGAWLVVNDRADVALAAGADGVQVGARGLTAADARRVMGDARVVGVSVHSADEAREALDGAPDFLLVGAIWETPSHPDRAGAGVERIREVAALGVPTVAIGGVTPARAADARRAGAAGVAVLRGVWDAPDPAAAVRAYLDFWKERS
ncbi:thiamine phosphate synthase [Longimicrobium sp.]|uniref:thiamine phosphate synthase n=1 Tax=Longimicrobium sp. TaxID=2029185 RepID=UPI002E36D50B|nr:thiamine phosphate synthase [Longimicrobium sp.]HEX6041790.1 thiamine phosphate synthase [Longimicrobium sp.]